MLSTKNIHYIYTIYIIFSRNLREKSDYFAEKFILFFNDMILQNSIEHRDFKMVILQNKRRNFAPATISFQGCEAHSYVNCLYLHHLSERMGKHIVLNIGSV